MEASTNNEPGLDFDLPRSECEPEQEWPWARQAAARVLRSSVTEVVLALLIGLSFALVIMETDTPDNTPDWVRTVNLALLVIYTVEVTARLFVFRLDFFFSLFNIIDLLVVLIDLVCTVMEAIAADALPSLTVLRVFRLLRLARSYKVMIKFPQLAQMVKGLVNATSAVFYGGVFLFMIITIWSIIAVQVIHPVSKRLGENGTFDGCERCPRAFATVKDSMMTFTQQIVAGDSWGQVTIPIVEAAPETAWFFGAVFVTVNLTIINVMLAVIVDSAQKAGEDDHSLIAQAKQDEFKQAAMKLRKLCQRMDTDGSGDLTKDELISGMDNIKEFRDLLATMDIKREDMNLVFGILDADGSGTVQYDEFISELFKMKSHDSHTMLIFIKHYVTEIRKGMEEQIHLLKNDLMAKFNEERGNEAFVGLGIETKSSTPCVEKPEVLGNALKSSLLPEEKRFSAGLLERSDDLRAELQRISNVISEDLARNMQSIAEQSANHTRLLTTMLDGVLPAHAAGHARGNGGGTKGGGALAPLLLPDPRSGGHPGVAAAGTCSDEASPHQQPWLQPQSPSSWATRTCCGVSRLDASRSAANGRVQP